MRNKISFKNDYSEGAHPSILELLQETNYDQEIGYGEDQLSVEAKRYIRKRMGVDDCPIYLVAGGTQANLLVISHLLKPFESVIAVDTGHIAVHETGAIENSGHKVNLVPNHAGKLKLADVEHLLQLHQDHHMVKPRMVYISQSTELGTVYTKAELTELYAFCQSKNLLLFIDGARLAVGLMSPASGMDLADMRNCCDVFYIGVTKNAGLLGEAIVFNRSNLAANFNFTLKQKGALLAKGRLLGAQFLALFRDDLYFQLAQHANEQSFRIASAIVAKGYRLASPAESNQLFPILPEEKIQELQKDFDFFVWEKLNENESVLRLVCSWATREEDVDRLIQAIQ